LESFPVWLQQEIAKKLEKRRLEIQKLERIAKQTRLSAKQIAEEAIAQYPMFIWESLRKEYEQYKARQDNGYGKAVFEFAEATAAISKILAKQNNKHLGVVLMEASDIASEACGGCTGFQWSIAKQILERYWLYGDVVQRVFQSYDS
jgi:hypothetical protein